MRSELVPSLLVLPVWGILLHEFCLATSYPQKAWHVKPPGGILTELRRDLGLGDMFLEKSGECAARPKEPSEQQKHERFLKDSNKETAKWSGWDFFKKMTFSDSVIACGCMRSLGPMGLSFVSSGVGFQPCLLVQDMSCQFCQLLESNGLDSTSAANSMAIKTGNENSIVIRKHYIIYIVCKINDSSNNFSQMWHGPYIYCRTNLCQCRSWGLPTVPGVFKWGLPALLQALGH